MPTKRCPSCARFFDGEELFCPQDAAPLERWQGSDPTEGRLLAGRYRIKQLLGEGGMGRVYVAEQLALERRVAVKLLRRARLGDVEARARFVREARAASRLRSPHTVRLYDFGESEDGELFLVMELLEGTTLRKLLHARHRLPPDEVMVVLDQVARSLAEAHARGIVHRDLKPENILIEETEADGPHARVLDFGVAWVSDERSGEALTDSQEIPGTPAYLAPERIAGGVVDARADVYALGVLAYELLAGRPPHHGATSWQTLASHVHEEPTPLAQAAPEVAVPDALVALIWRCLAKAPELRPSDAAAFRAALRQLRASSSTSSVATEDIERPTGGSRLETRPSGRRARRGFIAAGFVASLSGGLLVGAQLGADQTPPLVVSSPSLGLSGPGRATMAPPEAHPIAAASGHAVASGCERAPAICLDESGEPGKAEPQPERGETVDESAPADPSRAVRPPSLPRHDAKPVDRERDRIRRWLD